MKVSKILISAAAVLAVATAGYGDYTDIDWDGNGSEPGLDEIINQKILEGNHSIGEQEGGVRVNDKADGVWTIGGSYMSSNKMEFEFAGYRANNEFGMYDLSDPTNRVKIMDGSDGQGTQVSVTWDQALNRIVVWDATHLQPEVYDNTCFTTFGFYLDNTVNPGQFPYSSEASRNDQGFDHMVTYKGSNAFGQEDPSRANSPYLFGDGEYLICWEDLNLGDQDYNDMVVMVESTYPVPEPATVSLVGFGILGLMGLGWSRKRKS